MTKPTPAKTFTYIEQSRPISGLWQSVTMVVGRVDVTGRKDIGERLRAYRDSSPVGASCEIVVSSEERKLIRMETK